MGIFDYLMGYLFSYSRFREELELPIIQQQDEVPCTGFRRPDRFILRRLKKMYWKDLPEAGKNMHAKMTGEQQDLYQNHIQRLPDTFVQTISGRV